MPTNNKTPHYNLNSWLGSDKPTRNDFVSDNEIIDSALYTHESNTNLHLTADEKGFIANPYQISGYAGTGEATKKITFTFTPKAVFIFKKYSPFYLYDSTHGYTIINAAFTFPANEGSSGVSLVGKNLTVQQSTTATSGLFYNLNVSNGQYAYIAFK